MEMQDDLIKEFLVEAREHLSGMETDLLDIEEAGQSIDEDLVNKVFRAAHSIKGGSSFFGLNKIKELAHKTETVLDMIRSRRMVPNPEITNILLIAFDKLRDMLNNVAESETTDIHEHLSSLTGLVSSYLPEGKKDSVSQVALVHGEEEPKPIGIPQTDLERVSRNGQFVYAVEYDLIHDVERRGKSVLQVFSDLYESGEILDVVLDLDAVGTLDDPVSNKIPLRLTFATILDPDVIGGLIDVDEKKIRTLFGPESDRDSVPSSPGEAMIHPNSGRELVREDSLPLSPTRTVEAAVSAEPDMFRIAGSGLQASEVELRSKSPGAAGETTLRVDVSLLETLMNLAGELVLSRNQLREAVAQKDYRALTASSQRINLVTSELQDAIMQTRMQPIGNVFGKFPRLIRDMSQSLNKEIQLDIRGKEVELDKSLVEGLSDPLAHMVRNSADHGIELPEERLAKGKKRTGTIRLEARHEAGQVVVEIADDGRGLDPGKVAASALKKGLISREKLLGMSEKDKMALIFLPGLSTAEKVTDVSGRGVGMDVVKTNLDRLGGKVEIDSEPGSGTLFRIKLPLTLAIIPSLIVTVEGERFAIPQINVVELLRIRAEQAKVRIEVVGNSEVLILREQLVPLVRFSEFLGIPATYIDPNTGRREICRRAELADRRSARNPLEPPSECVPGTGEEKGKAERRQANGRRYRAAGDIAIAVVTTGTMQYGMVVDSFQNTEEIVVKPLGRHLKGLQEYAGATIMGDGKLALIVDATGLAAKADLTSLSGTARAAELVEQAETNKLIDTHSLLLFNNAPDELCATPLDTVLRIERISRQQIEMVGGRRTMQYRGKSLPLLSLSDAASVATIEDGRELAVIVSSVYGREVGLLGAMPVDVIETQASIDQKTHRQKGITGSAIIRGKTALLVDIHELVEAVYPDWTQEKETPLLFRKGGAKPTVLLAEDSDFFRAQVRRFLEEGGYTVLDAPDGQVAWEILLENSEAVRAVVTDIEMPRLSGLGLTQRIRSEPNLASLPIIGLTSLAGDDDIVRGKLAGVSEYQIKLDRDKLLEALQSQLGS